MAFIYTYTDFHCPVCGSLLREAGCHNYIADRPYHCVSVYCPVCDKFAPTFNYKKSFYAAYKAYCREYAPVQLNLFDYEL